MNVPDQLPFREHHLNWTNEKVARFWNFASRSEAFQTIYFSRLVGRGVVTFLKETIPLEGRVLDYGCGPGYLVEHLLAAGIACEGLDSSPETVAMVNRKFSGHPLWKGAVVAQGNTWPYPEHAFDAILCLETIEHILPERLESFLLGLRRALSRDGWLFITTPWQENLNLSLIQCADCGAVFHRMQHLRSITRQSLTALMEQHGFRTTLCDVTDFESFQTSAWPGATYLTPRQLMRLVTSSFSRLLDAVTPRHPGLPSAWARQYLGKGHNLFWLGMSA